LPITLDNAAQHVAGVCLLNDWSARDIQRWEYQPLGPFLAKNFATSLSPWLVTLEALEPFRTAAPAHDVPVLPYLQETQPGAFDIHVECWLQTKSMAAPIKLSRGSYQEMYWTMAQMVAHHTVNGCALRAGDILGSGTISGPDKTNRGCLLELTWKGTESVELPGGEKRTFLEVGDTVTLKAYAERSGARRIGFGECRGTIL
jgi:fumarylacetoacetase